MNRDMIERFLDEMYEQGHRLDSNDQYMDRKTRELIKVQQPNEYYFAVSEYTYRGYNVAILIEVFLNKNDESTFRVQMSIKDVFRIVGKHRPLDTSLDIEPILKNIEELKLKVKREFVELDCI